MTRCAAALVLLLSLNAAASGSGAVYRTVDSNGRVHFSDQPPYKGAKPMIIGGIASGPAIRKLDDPASARIIARAPRFAVHFNAPTPGQIYREPAVNVAVSVMPGLAKGFGLIYRVDDKIQNSAPDDDIRTTLHNLGAGDHAITVSLISPDGRELARSAPVNIKVKPEIAKN
jgi:hypothetical protein